MPVSLKKTLSAILLVLVLTSLKAQESKSTIKLPELNLSRNSQRMFEESLKEVVFCMRQEYVIQNRRGEKFGHLDKAYFGKKYTIGVIVGSDMCFPSYLRKPWEGDERLLEYKKSHKPVCSVLYIKNINGGLQRELTNLNIDTTSAISSFKQGPVGLKKADDTDGLKEYLMLYHIPVDSEEVFPDITVTLHHIDDVQWNGNGTAEIKNFNFMGKEAIGGILLKEYIATGTIELRVAGLYVLNGDKWIVQSLIDPNQG
jgi:hypothetical protein